MTAAQRNGTGFTERVRLFILLRMEKADDSPRIEMRLGEVALRVTNMDRMVDFYVNAVRLVLLRREPHMAFFRIAEGYQGHTSVLALFKRKGDESQGSFDHMAFSIGREDYDAQKRHLEGLGLPVRTAQHNWVQWRSLYVDDPEGNEVEFVCYDPSIPKNDES